MVDLALKLKAGRIEIAHVRYYGWALKNRAALMPTAEQLARAAAAVEELRRKHQGKIVIDAVPPAFVGGSGRRSLTITPSGRVLPCHAAEAIPGLTFWNVRERALGDIWEKSPAFKALRDTDFLPALGADSFAELAAVQQDTPYAYRRM
jgi:pyrroloquinoline quinone biosynthesis protein E